MKSTDLCTVAGGGVVIRRSGKLLRTHVRKVCINGNSSTVSLPPSVLRHLNLLPGDWLAIAVEEDSGGFVARVLRQDRAASTPSIDMTTQAGVAR